MSPQAISMVEEACNIAILLWISYIISEIFYRGFKKDLHCKFAISICNAIRIILLVCAIIASLFTPAGAILTLLAIFLGGLFIYIGRKI